MDPKIAVRVGVGVVLAGLLGQGLDPLLGLDRHFLLLAAAWDFDGGREVVERGPGLHRDDVGRRAGELARGVVEHDVRVAAEEDGLVVAVDGLLVVPAAYVVEGDAVEDLELEVQPGLDVLSGCHWRACPRACGLFPAHVRADADEVLGHDDLGDIDDRSPAGGGLVHGQGVTGRAALVERARRENRKEGDRVLGARGEWARVTGRGFSPSAVWPACARVTVAMDRPRRGRVAPRSAEAPRTVSEPAARASAPPRH